MRARWRDGESINSLSRAFGVCYNAAYAVVHRQSHKDDA
jgi:hypothetical protein